MTTLGVVFRPQFPPERLRAAAVAAEAAGVDELWLWEDCFEHSGVAAAAAALAWTERITIGVGILPVPLRNPALTAMEVATLARLFPGRVHVGLGHGVQEWMDQVGARAASPMTLLREYVDAVRALLAGDTVTTDGRYVRLRDVTLSWPPIGHTPVSVGAVGPRTIELAAQAADGLVLTSDTSSDGLRAARTRYDAARGDRPGRVTVYLMAVTGPDSAARYADEAAHWKLDPSADVGVHGDAAEVAAAVRSWAEAGADAVILQPTAADDPVAYARFAGEQVRPLLG